MYTAPREVGLSDNNATLYYDSDFISALDYFQNLYKVNRQAIKATRREYLCNVKPASSWLWVLLGDLFFIIRSIFLYCCYPNKNILEDAFKHKTTAVSVNFVHIFQNRSRVYRNIAQVQFTYSLLANLCNLVEDCSVLHTGMPYSIVINRSF